jgi:hypothetical protein
MTRQLPLPDRAPTVTGLPLLAVSHAAVFGTSGPVWPAGWVLSAG